jgi:hypothetical protein
MTVKPASNTDVDAKGSSDSTGAWEQAAQEAKDVGIRWHRKSSMTRPS